MVVKEFFARLGLDADEASFAQGDALLGGVHKALLGLATAAAGAAAGLAVLVKQTAAAGAEAKDASARMGITTDEVQELGFAARMSDASLEELQQALVFLAKKGSKDVARDLGVLADQIAALDEADRVAFAFENFGKAGTRLLPFLVQGSEGIARLRAEAREMGLVLDRDAIEAADGFDDALQRIGERLTGLRNRTIGPWLPRFEKLILKVERAIARASNALAAMMRWIDVIAVALGSVLLAALVAVAGGFEMIAVTAFIAGIEGITAAIGIASAWAAAAAPVLALAALFALVAIVLEDIYVALTGGDSLIGELGRKWTAFLDSWFNNTNGDGWLVNAVKALVASVTDLGASVPQAIDFWIASFKRFFAWVGEQFGLLTARMQALLERPLGVIRRLFGDAPAPDGVPAVGPGGGLSAVDGMGGGASPAASVGASASRVAVAAPQFAASFTVNAAPGMDGQAVAGAVRAELDEWFDAKMRATAAAVGA